MAVIKQNAYGQITSFNLPLIATKKNETSDIKLLEAIYSKSREPYDCPVPFEYIERQQSYAAYVIADEKYTIIVLASIFMSDKDIIAAGNKLKERVTTDEDQFFIRSYI